MEYNFGEVEKKWQQFWALHKTFAAKNPAESKVLPNREDLGGAPKYYVLDMFPYPSGAGLHVGHPLGYIASDIVARYKRHKGFNVLHPMGYDSFGLPAEQYAIQTGQHPAITTENNIKRYREQLDKIGFSFDWEREVRTSDPEYYKWTQWIFIKLFHSWYNTETNKAESIDELISKFETGNLKFENPDNKKSWTDLNEKEKSDVLMNYRLAYLSEAWVNWCPQLGTVLANEEVKEGVSERGGYPVERKLMPQWSLRITAYAERLLNDLEKIDWSESIKEAQRNWIGKSEGSSLKFYLSPDPSPPERGTSTVHEPNPEYFTTDSKSLHLLIDNAKQMRSNPTKAENILWEQLRAHNSGFKIRRQHIIDRFIVDFVCLSKMMVIEVDGDIHDLKKEEDEQRTSILNDEGFKVIRVTNEEVINHTSETVEKIISQLSEQKNYPQAENNINIVKERQEEYTISNTKGTKQNSAVSGSPSLEERGLGGEVIEVFTTRPDTIFGVSFLTLAPEHELIEKIASPDYKQKVEEYITYAKNRSERERMTDVKKITGQFTGAYAIHPFTKKEIPIWIGEYVLAGYGTGAVMGVPAHDSRDFAFANYFKLPIIKVIQPNDKAVSGSPSLEEKGLGDEVYDAKEGVCINSDFLNGLEVKDAIKKAIAEIEKKNIGKGKTNFRLRDAIFGRQRYWGEPIPVYYKDGIPHTLSENELPLVLPEVDKYLPTESGEPPLARATDWTYKPHLNPPRGGGLNEPSRFKKREEGAVPEHETADGLFYEHTKTSSRENRRNPTEAEKILWEYLRKEQTGYKIRRQHIIDIYIADFVCLEKKVVIEVDGKYHEHQNDYDAARTEMLHVKEFTVIRFTNEEVISNPKKVQQKIKKELEEKILQNEKVLPNGEDLGGAYPLETTTMPGWAGSSWYYLRYMDAKNKNEFVSKEAVNYWKDVDLYIGGSEHATGHLLYVRFWTKFLFDLGYIPITEPAKKLINQGMIQGVSEKIYRNLSKSMTMPTGIILNTEHKTIGGFNIYSNEPVSFFFSAENVDRARKFINENNGDEEYLKSFTYFKDNVDINIVENSYLNIEEFIEWKPEYSNAVFICTGGYWHLGKFNKYQEALQVGKIENGSDQFKLFQEVEKMSKSKWNVVTPDDIIEKYGADCLRMYEMFLGPLEQSKPWNTNGISGVSNFIRKLWRLFHKEGSKVLPNGEDLGRAFRVSNEAPTKAELKILHKTIKKATEDIEKFSFNTSVSSFMICVNELTDLKCNKREILEPLCILISPYAPHIAEELWEKLGHTKSISDAPFPICNEEYLTEDSFEYPVSVNGKTRFKINIPLNISKEEIESQVMHSDEMVKYLNGNHPKKIIVVPGRIVNVVI